MPSIRNAIMVDTVRGVLRVRKWPRKRGTPKSALQRWWNDWFRQANLLAKYADGMAMARAIEMTKDSGLYPRDVMLQAMRGRLYIFADQDGMKWYPMAAIQDISDSLDVLAQTVGSVLVRATDRWRAPPPGAINQVLTNQGAGAPAIWATPAGGGGVVEVELPGTPIVFDGSQSQYDFDVTGYAGLTISFDDVDLASSGYPLVRCSVDGGTIFKNAGTDYQFIGFTQAASVNGTTSALIVGNTSGTTNHNGNIRVSGLRVPRLFYQGCAGRVGQQTRQNSGITLFDGPITDIRIENTVGALFNSGTCRIVGSLKG